jgi:hypothetical protein
MRAAIVLLIAGLGLTPAALGQSCTGLCLQQVTCPSGGATTISGTIYAPNGVDPLPNVTVYIPNAAVAPFTAGVSCPVIGQPPSGSPLVGTMTNTDGTFTLVNVPVGSNIPLVIQSGRWRRQLVVPSTASCTNTSFSTRMPKNQGEGDIPKIAIATGRADSVECVLRKIGIDDAEFTDPSGSGRINVYSGSGRTNTGGVSSAGALIDAATPSEDLLMGNVNTLNQYDALMLPCEGGQYNRNTTQLANIIQYANAGGRVYTSHYGYVWMYQNPPFNGIGNWQVNQAALPDGTATIDTTFTDGSTLADWLQLIGASTTKGQMAISAVKHDMNGVIAPTQSWLTLNDTTHNNPVMQLTFNTPIGAQNQCGRVLFNEYHVEDPGTANTTNVTFPNECSNGAMTPQEKLLEFSLFNLTGSGGVPTLAPAAKDFGNEAIGFTSASQPFLWKNNSIFSAYISSATVTGDFIITSNNCSSVASGSTCEIDVAFKPTALGQRTGTLTVATAGTNLTASLTGTGIPALVPSATALDFGNLDVGATATKTITITNNAPGPVPVPSMTVAGDYSLSSSCGATLAASGTCQVAIIFKPTTTGKRTGAFTVNSSDPAYSGLAPTLTGNGVDFTLTANPTSGELTAGYSAGLTATTSPIAGFASSVTLSCATTAPASSCTPSVVSFIPTAPVIANVTITTKSKYTVIGYGAFGGSAFLTLIALGSACLLWANRRKTHALVRLCLLALMLTAATALTSGCSGKYPDLNNPYTTPGTYTYTLTATDGFLTHSATYTLKVD